MRFIFVASVSFKTECWLPAAGTGAGPCAALTPPGGIVVETLTPLASPSNACTAASSLDVIPSKVEQGPSRPASCCPTALSYASPGAKKGMLKPGSCYSKVQHKPPPPCGFLCIHTWVVCVSKRLVNQHSLDRPGRCFLCLPHLRQEK